MPLSATILGQGRPVVLLPGFALDSAVMAAACEPAFATAAAAAADAAPVAVRDWQRIYLDLPGTGGSPAGEPTSEAVLTEVRNSISDLIGDTRYLLVGHSYGGYLATGLVRRDPARIAGMCLICTGARIRPSDRDLSGVLASAPEPGWLDGVPDDLHEHFSYAIGRQTRAVADRVAAAFAQRGPVDDVYLEALRPAGYQLADSRTSEPDPANEPDPAHEPDPANEQQISAFAGPVSLLAGRRDRIGGYRDLFAALTGYPNGNFTALADAGHYLPFEEPEYFALAIRDWLARTP